MKHATIYQVDAFSEIPFKGNPAAVCLLSTPKNSTWMQRVAMEMNLSETAFLLSQGHGFNLRWFTPKVEVNLCGHGTLASAHALWEAGLLRPEQTARFRTRSGILTATRKGSWIELNFPRLEINPTRAPQALLRALKVSPIFVGKTKRQYLLEVQSESEIRNLSPDFELLKTIPAHGFIVTSRSNSRGWDFISRYFAPREGVAEDPVTGSAHCALGPFWGEKLNKEMLVGYQASARGGIVRIRVGNDRVFLGGKAVTVLHGELRI